ncbi:MAG: ring-opening amidohydrolase [Pseudomonadota bacterium]
MLNVRTIAMENPGDTSDLSAKLAALDRRGLRKLAIVGKTEGPASANDYSRELVLLETRLALEKAGGAELMARTSMIFSTGCEGVMTPLAYLFADFEETGGAGGPERLAMGAARTRRVRPAELGKRAHVELIADGVRQAMADARLAPVQVALTMVKIPRLCQGLAGEAEPGVHASIDSSYAKGVAGLGIGMGLGDIAPAQVFDEMIGRDLSVYCNRAITFSGTETGHNEILLFGNRPGAGGDLFIVSTPLVDLFDAPAIRRTLVAAGCRFNAFGAPEDVGRIRATFLKLGMPHDGRIRGLRTAIPSSQLDPEKHVRAAASGMLGSVIGTSGSFISGGSDHQAPPGGGLFACVLAVNGAPAR